MSKVNREMIGEPVTYKGHILVTRRHDEKIMSCVNDEPLEGFHRTPEAARLRGMRHVDKATYREPRSGY